MVTMLTKKILSDIGNPELKKRLSENKAGRLEWIQNSIDKFRFHRIRGTVDVSGSLQQTDLLRPFYLAIAEHGLQYAFDNASQFVKPGDLPVSVQTNTISVPNNSDKHVIIVGGGISGLVAAYELRKQNYNVKILEMSQRFGGRVKTFTQKDGFDRGLHSDAGAMRIPQEPNPQRPVADMIHYLTDYYAMKEFELVPTPFSNSDDDAYYCFYGIRTKIKEWKDSQFTEYWPGWDAKIKKTHPRITNINAYYEATVDVVIQLLKNRLKDIPAQDLEAQAVQWQRWTDNWCQFSFGSFVRSTLDGIKTQLIFDEKVPENDPTLNKLKEYLPWPEAAITAYSVFNYTLSDDISLTAEVQERMGNWWTDKMHSLEGGLSALPEAFAGRGDVEQCITYNRMVTKVVYNWDDNQTKSVEVHGVITSSGEPFVVEGRSVILTVPLHVLRGIQIVNKNPNGTPFPLDYQKAIENISYSPSTKIMLQYEEQFWNIDDANITGGFSKTNMPIGQLHYPTNVVKSGDLFKGVPALPKHPGILMVYTWKAEALLWGALTEEQALMLAVNQIEEIHPGTKHLYQMGKRQPWADDPTTLGAFAMLRPQEYISVMYLMQHSWRNVYFAGEAISFANGWIQGALESGLRAAYELFADDQKFQQINPSTPVSLIKQAAI